MREILREAGVTGPTLYYHFGSKEDLLLTLLKERFESFIALATAELSGQPTLEAALSRHAELTLDGLASHSETVRFVFTVLNGPQASLPQKPLRDWKATFFRWLRDIVARYADGASESRILFASMAYNALLSMYMLQFLSGLVTRLDRSVVRTIAARAAAILHDELPVPDIEFSPDLTAIEGVL